MVWEIAQQRLGTAAPELGGAAAVAQITGKTAGLSVEATKQLAAYNVALYHRMTTCASKSWFGNVIDNEYYDKGLDVMAAGANPAFSFSATAAYVPSKLKGIEGAMWAINEVGGAAYTTAVKMGDVHKALGVEKDSAFGVALSL